MSCFNYLCCFTRSKHPKCQRGEVCKVSDSTKQNVVTEPNCKKKLKDFLNSKSTKSVEFDLDIETCKELSTNVSAEHLVEKSSEIAKESVESNVENGISSVQSARHLSQSDDGIKLDSAEVGQDFSEGNVEKESANEEEILDESKLLPRKNRYENCSKDDESEDIGLEDGNGTVVQAESSESLFSLSIDSRKKVYAAEIGEKEVTSATPKQVLRDQEGCAFGVYRNENVHSVLNPVENLTQCEAIKASPTSHSFGHQEKENISVEQDESPKPSFQRKSEENAVNTSLSSWLVGPETSPVSKDGGNCVRKSPISPEDRPILGALTVGDLKFSASISPKRSRSKSPEEMPIIGTVGSYWHHTGQTVDSNSSSSCTSMSNPARENKETQRVQLNSMSFQERLERAVE